MFEDGIKYFICPEMRKLRRILDKNGIAWEDKSDKGTDWIWMCRTHFNYKGFYWSVIHGIGSYGGIMPGARIGGVLLEVMSNALDESPIGSLKAKEIWELMQEAPDCSEEKKRMSEKEEFLIAMVKTNSKEMAIQYLQDYVQRNGFLSNEAGDEVKRLLEEKA